MGCTPRMCQPDYRECLGVILVRVHTHLVESFPSDDQMEAHVMYLSSRITMFEYCTMARLPSTPKLQTDPTEITSSNDFFDEAHGGSELTPAVTYTTCKSTALLHALGSPQPHNSLANCKMNAQVNDSTGTAIRSYLRPYISLKSRGTLR